MKISDLSIIFTSKLGKTLAEYPLQRGYDFGVSGVFCGCEGAESY